MKEHVEIEAGNGVLCFDRIGGLLVLKTFSPGCQ